MDPLGKIAREFLKQAHANQVRNALALSREFRKEGMNLNQVEEMLYASGFDEEVINDTLNRLPEGSK